MATRFLCLVFLCSLLLRVSWAPLPTLAELDAVAQCRANGSFVNLTQTHGSVVGGFAPMPLCVSQCPAQSVSFSGDCVVEERFSSGLRLGLALRIECDRSTSNDGCAWMNDDRRVSEGVILRIAQMLGGVPIQELRGSHLGMPGNALDIQGIFIARRGEPGFSVRRLSSDHHDWARQLSSGRTSLLYVVIRADTRRLSPGDPVVQQLLNRDPVAAVRFLGVPTTIFNASFSTGLPAGGAGSDRDYQLAIQFKGLPWSNVGFAAPTTRTGTTSTITTTTTARAVAQPASGGGDKANLMLIVALSTTLGLFALMVCLAAGCLLIKKRRSHFARDRPLAVPADDSCAGDPFGDDGRGVALDDIHMSREGPADAAALLDDTLAAESSSVDLPQPSDPQPVCPHPESAQATPAASRSAPEHLLGSSTPVSLNPATPTFQASRPPATPADYPAPIAPPAASHVDRPNPVPDSSWKSRAGALGSKTPNIPDVASTPPAFPADRLPPPPAATPKPVVASTPPAMPADPMPPPTNAAPKPEHFSNPPGTPTSWSIPSARPITAPVSSLDWSTRPATPDLASMARPNERATPHDGKAPATPKGDQNTPSTPRRMQPTIPECEAASESGSVMKDDTGAGVAGMFSPRSTSTSSIPDDPAGVNKIAKSTLRTSSMASSKPSPQILGSAPAGASAHERRPSFQRHDSPVVLDVQALASELKAMRPKSLEERKQYFRQLCLRCHPDKNLQDKELAGQAFQFLQEKKDWFLS